MVLYHYAISEARVRNASAVINFARFTDHGLAFDLHIRVNHTVRSNPGLIADVSMRRVDKCDTTFEHQPPNCASSQKIFKLGEFGPRIDARYLARVAMFVGHNLLPSLKKNRRHVGKIVFPLFVRRFHFFQSRKQCAGLKTINTRIDLTNRALFFSSIFLLDDLQEITVLIAYYSSITRRVFQTHSQNRASCVLMPMLIIEATQSFQLNQRHVA